MSRRPELPPFAKGGWGGFCTSGENPPFQRGTWSALFIGGTLMNIVVDAYCVLAKL